MQSAVILKHSIGTNLNNLIVEKHLPKLTNSDGYWRCQTKIIIRGINDSSVGILSLGRRRIS